jgi:cytochrome c
MQTQRIVPATLIVPLLAVLYGCQPQDSPQRAQAPAVPIAPKPAADHAVAGSVLSQADFTKLAKDIGCFSCHSIEKKLLGPAWKSVAVLYRDDPAAEAKMMDKIAKGGGGAWGNIAMPAYPDLGEEKSRTLVRFILSLK